MNNQPSESPFGNPRFLAALAITFFGLWGWQYYISQKYPQQNISANQTESLQVSTTASATVPTQNNSQLETTSSKNIITHPETTLKFENETVSFEVSSNGMALKNYTLKDYTHRDGSSLSFDHKSGQFATLVANQAIHFQISQTTDGEFVGLGEVNGVRITKKITYDKQLNFLKTTVSFDGSIDSLQTQIFDKKLVPQSKNFLTPSFEQQDFVIFSGGKIISESITQVKDGAQFNHSSNAAQLIAINSQYFTMAAINKSDIVPDVLNAVNNDQVSSTINYKLAGTSVKTIDQILFLGPKKADTLKAIDPLLPEVLNYGMFGFIAKPLLSLMVLIHTFVGNWGLAIIVLTLIVRSILLPFNVISFRSAQAMQKIKPRMDALREKFKDDPMRMNKETMALMKEANANPLSGCLPMLIQIPIFFALWKTIGSSIEIYQQPFFGWIVDLSYHDKFFVFPILMGITMYFQQKMTPTTMDPMQAKILNFMPIIFTLFMLTLPSGLTLYNFVSALFGVVQQYFLLKETKTHGTQVVQRA